jgi:multidrug efflux system outer membrane protein
MNGRLRALTLVLLALVLGVAAEGCAVGPDYARPKLKPPPAFRFQPDAAKAACLADLPWWNVFRDPILQSLLGDALGHNLDLATAAARVEVARAQARATGVTLLPAVQGTVSADYVHGALGPGFLPPPNLSAYSAGIVASWELDVWGRIRRNIEAATALYAASEEVHRGVWVMVVGDVAQQYFQLLALDAQRQNAIDAITVRKNTYNLFQIQNQGGVASGLEVARAEANLQGALATLASVEQDIAITENAISFLLGRPPGPILRGTPLSALASPPDVPAGVPSSLLERRPDIREAEQNLISANAQIGVATANFFPVISLTGMLGGVSNDLAHLSSHSFWVYSGGGALNWLAPILQGDQLRWQLRAAKAQWLAARATYERAVLNAFREVADALIAFQKLRQQRIEREKQVQALIQSVEISQTRYRGGTASYLDVVNAQELLLPAQLDLARIEGAQFSALVQLYRALGGGWWAATSAP